MSSSPPVPPMIPVPQALEIVLQQVWERKPKTSLSTKDPSAGQVLAAAIRVPTPGYPTYRASIMDGYAVCSGSGHQQRTIVDRILAGDDVVPLTDPSTAVYITTGAPVPELYDCIVPIEKCTVHEDQLTLSDTAILAPNKWIRPIGCDLAPDTELLPRGHVLDAVSLALLSQVQCEEVQVTPIPTVGVLSTGDELLSSSSSNTNTATGRIPDANRPLLLNMIRHDFGCPQVFDLGQIGDDRDALETCLRRAVQECDIVVTTGGISRGDADYLAEILVERMVGKMHFGHLHMKPGKPTTLVTFDDCIVLCLPGNPVSAAVCAHLLLAPAVDLWMRPCDSMNDARVHPELQVVVTHDILLDKDRPEYHRVRLDWSMTMENGLQLIRAASTGVQQSSRLLSMRDAQALLVLPQGTSERPKILDGETVMAVLLPSANGGKIDDVPFTQSQHLKKMEGGKRHVCVSILRAHCKECYLNERVEKAMSGSKSGSVSIASNRLFDGPASDVFDVALQEPADITIIVTPCLGTKCFRRSLELSQAVASRLEKSADGMAQQARQGCASQDARSALFETRVGFAQGRMIALLPLEGVEGGLSNIRGLLKHAVELGRGHGHKLELETKE